MIPNWLRHVEIPTPALARSTVTIDKTAALPPKRILRRASRRFASAESERPRPKLPSSIVSFFFDKSKTLRNCLTRTYFQRPKTDIAMFTALSLHSPSSRLTYASPGIDNDTV